MTPSHNPKGTDVKSLNISKINWKFVKCQLGRISHHYGSKTSQTLTKLGTARTNADLDVITLMSDFAYAALRATRADITDWE